MAETILVIGATGRLGAPVARHIREGGYIVRIMARNNTARRERFSESYEVVPGDVLDTDSLEKALGGCFGVHVSISGEAEQVGAENVASLTRKLDLGQITYISGTNTFEENARFATVQQKLGAERAVPQRGVPYTILCPTFAMDVLPMHVQRDRAIVFGKQPKPLHWIAGDDIGRMTLAAYRNEKAQNTWLFLHGPEPIRTPGAVQR